MNYKKVTVFTPMEILENTEISTNKLHEDILKDMLGKEVFKELDEMEETKKHSNSILFYGAPVSLATYCAYNVGFSVCFETENSTVFFLSDFITDEMIGYINENYGVPQNKILAFETLMDNENGQKIRYQKEPSFTEILIDDYEVVFEDLMCVLENKKNRAKKK